MAGLNRLRRLAFVLLLAPAPSLAQPESPRVDTPQVQYRKAHEAINDKRWVDARRLLVDLWSRSHTYDVASSLVFVEYQLGNYAAAANHAAFAIRNAPPIEKPEEIERLKRALDELKHRVGAVTVVVDQPGAEIRVDSEPIGTSPLPADVYVDVGPHWVDVRLPEGIEAKKRVDALAGETYRVELTLASTGASTTTPPPASPAASASTAPATGPSREPAPSRNFAPAIVAGSIGGVALVTGIVSFVISANQDADANERLGKLGGQNPCGAGIEPGRERDCAEISDLADSADTYRAVGFVGLGTAVAAGAVTYVLWPSSRSQPAGVGVTPTVSVTQRGFTAALRGTF
jgi:hypothetical protein